MALRETIFVAKTLIKGIFASIRIAKVSAGCLPAIYCLALILLPSISFGSVYYVDNLKGNDTYDGSIHTPWRTFQHALGQVAPGNTVNIVANGPQNPYRESLNPVISGKTGQVIRIQGLDGANPVYITASDDLSYAQASGTAEWSLTEDRLWELRNTPEVYGLWFAPQAEWVMQGVNSLKSRKNAKNAKNLDTGTWLYERRNRTLKYKPLQNERIEDLHIEGVHRTHNINIVNKHYISLGHIRSLLVPASAAIAISRGSTHITLNDVGARHSYNGISVGNGGDNITITRCQISDIANNGIVFGGGPENHLSNTVIGNCEISNVRSNDCITLHKDKYKNDIGKHHLIENNVLHHCGEQGLDITSGTQIIAKNNVSFDNGVSGIAIGHGVSNVLVDGHSSRNEGAVAGLIIGPSDNVTVSNSLFYNSNSRMLRVHKAKNLIIQGNTFIAGPSSSGVFIEFLDQAENVVFKSNIFTSVAEANSLPYIQFLRFTPQTATASFHDNIWWPPGANKGSFLVQDQGRFKIDTMASTYKLSITDRTVDPGIRLNERNSLYKIDQPTASDYGCNCDFPD